jgi:hypothetical protein
MTWSTVTRQRGGRSGVRLPTGSRGFSLHQNVQTDSRAHEAFHLKGTERLFSHRGIGRDVKVTIHLHLVPRLRMSGVISLLLVYFHAVDWENFFRLTSRTGLKISDCLRLIRYLQHDYELREYHEYIKTNNYKFLIR